MGTRRKRTRAHDAVLRAARQYGYEFTEDDIIHAGRRSIVVRATLEDQTFILKGTTRKNTSIRKGTTRKDHSLRGETVTKEFETPPNEVRAQQFLWRTIPATASFRVPRTSIVEASHSLFLMEQEYLLGEPLAHQRPPKLQLGNAEETYDDVFHLLRDLHAYSAEIVPAYFHKLAREKFTPEYYLERQYGALIPAVRNEIVTDTEANGLLEIVASRPWPRAFCHHDVQYSNLIRLPDGRLGLIDAEFARWGMRYYDIAYLFLTYMLIHGEIKVAREQFLWNLLSFSDAFPTEEISHEIFVPLAYRLCINLNQIAHTTETLLETSRDRRLKKETGDQLREESNALIKRARYIVNAVLDHDLDHLT